jgi:hypothetical protein
VTGGVDTIWHCTVLGLHHDVRAGRWRRNVPRWRAPRPGPSPRGYRHRSREWWRANRRPRGPIPNALSVRGAGATGSPGRTIIADRGIADGKKEPIALADGYRESEQSWKELLLGVKARGLEIEPALAIGDEALGFWKAMRQVWDTTREQRCWVHKTANVLDKLPKGSHRLSSNPISS